MTWITLVGAAMLTGSALAQVRPVASDAKIERVIRGRLSRSQLHTENILVSVHGGIVTLQGQTNVFQHKSVATQLARHVGATGLRNDIHISDEARLKAAHSVPWGAFAGGIDRTGGIDTAKVRGALAFVEQ